MRSILYLIAVILIIGWIFGFFVSGAGNLIHILLVLAVVSLLLGFIRRGFPMDMWGWVARRIADFKPYDFWFIV